MPDGKTYSLENYLADKITELNSVIEMTDDEAAQEIDDQAKIGNQLGFETGRKYRLWAVGEKKKVEQLRATGEVNPVAYPDFNLFYQDWASTNGSLTMGGKVWQSTDGNLWDYSRYQSGEVVLAPLDKNDQVKMWNDYLGVNKGKLTEKDISDAALARDRLNRDLASDAATQRRWETEQGDVSYNRAQAILDRNTEAQEKAAGLAESRRQFDVGQTAQGQQLQQQRDETLAQLKSQPGNWIQAWMFENAPAIQQANQKAQEWIRVTSEIPDIQARAQESANYLYSNYPLLKGQDINKWVGSSGDTQQSPDVLMAARGAQTWQNRLAGAQGMAGTPMPALPQTTPNAPEWLPNFVPGLQAGQPITQQRARVASGQQWAATPWSQRQMLGGYLGYASPMGVPTLNDYVDLVNSMLPVAERTIRTAPGRQR